MDKDSLTGKMGKLIVVTPPSMTRPQDISFTIMNLNDKQKTMFTDKLNELFPENEITIFVWDKSKVKDKWLEEANLNSDYVIKGDADITKQIEKIKARLAKLSGGVAVVKVGAAALGVRNTSQWNKDINTPTNKAFVGSFLAEYDRLPSLYASQGFDTANLLLSALETTSVSDSIGFRSALKAANFTSVRGNFKFGSNNHPIHNVYIREVVREGDIFTNKIIGKVLSDHGDPYSKDCKM